LLITSVVPFETMAKVYFYALVTYLTVKLNG